MKKTLLFLAVSLTLQNVTRADETQENDVTKTVALSEYTEQYSNPDLHSAALSSSAIVAAEKIARSKQTALTQINLPSLDQLQQAKAAGTGVLVGVADTGANVNHLMLKGQITQTYNVFDGTSNVTDTNGHGTFVASEIAGTLDNGAVYEGVAPYAKLAIAKIFNSAGSTSSYYADTGVNWLVNTAKVSIVSLSLAARGAVMYNSLSNGVSKGVLFTVAAGNEGLSTSDWPAEFAKEKWANNQIIAVGSAKQVNGAWALSSFSNRPGDIANWYVMAPGESVLSGAANGGYTYMSGTSMATPLVAGQAALLKSLWPQLKADDLAKIIFKSAQRVCSGSVKADICAARTTADPLYGWGVIDIGKSLQPTNVVSVSTVNGKTISVSSLSLGTTGGVLGGSLRAASTDGAFKMAGTDEFNRQFFYDIGQTLQTHHDQTVSHMLESSDRLLRYTELALDQQGSKLAFASNHANTTDSLKLDSISQQITPQDSIVGAAIVQKLSNGHEFTSSTGGMNLYFGLAGSKVDGAAALAQSQLANPYLGLVSQATSVGYGVPITTDTTLKMGVSTSKLSNQLLGQYGINNSNTAHTQAALVEVSHQFKNSEVGVEVAQLGEDHALLGSQMGSGFELSTPAQTTAMTIHGAVKLSEKATIAGYFSQGYTKGFENSDSLVSAVSNVKSQGFGVGLSYADAFKTDDRLTVSISSPLSARSGSMQLNLPTNVDENGNVVRDIRHVDLGSAPREIRTEANYAMPLSKQSALNATLLLRHNPSDIEAKNEVGVAVRYTYKF